ncbi:hypothetical protein Q5M85_00625 [Paraclostridium bifermentans]|nr:hypothetical protein [Paraclostridium bifermentans]
MRGGYRGIKKNQTDESNNSVKSTKISNKDDKYEILKYDNGDTYKGELVDGKEVDLEFASLQIRIDMKVYGKKI